MSQERLLRTLASMAAADGNISADESAILFAMGEEIGVDAANLISTLGSSSIEIPAEAEREPTLEGMVDMLLADGVVSNAEELLLKKAAAQMGISESRLRTVVRRVFTRLTGLSGSQCPEQIGEISHVMSDLRVGVLRGDQNHPVVFEWDALHLIDGGGLRKLTDPEVAGLTLPQAVRYRRKQIGPDHRMEVSSLVVLVGEQERLLDGKIFFADQVAGDGILQDDPAGTDISFLRKTVWPPTAFDQLEANDSVKYLSKNNRHADVVIPVTDSDDGA